MLYLATPYYHPSPEVRNARYQAAKCFLEFYMRQKIPAYSPIVHCHHSASALSDWTNEDFVEYDLAFLKLCSAMVICPIPGYEVSKGILREMKFAKENNIEIQIIFASGILSPELEEACRG